MSTEPWQTDALDLAGYLSRIGVPVRPPSRAALDEIHERHMRTFPFDNIDVLLGQHPGVDLEAVQGKFVGRGRGGYCFEHATLLTAALQRLGYDAERRLARVGDPAALPISGRTHLVVEIVLDGVRLLADPGFGMSITRPVPLRDGHEVDQGGWRFRVTHHQETRTWQLDRARRHGWEPMHTMDELAVVPQDIHIGHHWTSTSPTSHFRRDLVVAKLLDGSHVTITSTTVTIRRPGEPTEHRPLAPGELLEWLDRLGTALTDDETQRLLARLESSAQGG